MKDVPGRANTKSFHDPDVIPFGDNYPAVSSFEWAEHVFQHVTEGMPIWRFSTSHFQSFSCHESVKVLFSYTIRRTNELGPVPWNLDWDHEWGTWKLIFDILGSLNWCSCYSTSLLMAMHVFLLARGLLHAALPRYGRRWNKIKVCEGYALAGFPSLGCHQLRILSNSIPCGGNWSSTSSLKVLTDSLWIPAQPKRRSYSAFI